MKVAGATEDSSRGWVFWRLARSMVGVVNEWNSQTARNGMVFLTRSGMSSEEKTATRDMQKRNDRERRDSAGKPFSTARARAVYTSSIYEVQSDIVYILQHQAEYLVISVAVLELSNPSFFLYDNTVCRK